MDGQTAKQDVYKEWQVIPTGKKLERSIHINQLQAHPDYPQNLDTLSDDAIPQIIFYLLREGAPPHRIYVMPNSEDPDNYYVIGWLKVYKAYKLLGISDSVPTLCYFDPDAHVRLWENWLNCPGDIFDIK